MISQLFALIRNAVLLYRLVIFDIFFGKRRGLLAIGRGVVFSPTMDLGFGKRCWLGPYTVFQGDGIIRVGDSTYIGAFASFNCVGRITIGENCMLANFVSIIDNNHGMSQDLPYGLQTLSTRPIVIGSNCWLGEKAIILPGVTIGDNAVVAAGAVVREDVPASAVVAGVPAKIVKMLGVTSSDG